MTKNMKFNRSGRGYLAVIVLLLVTSGGLRFSDGAAFAQPKEFDAPASNVVADHRQKSELLEALLAREAALKEKESKLNARQEKLVAIQAEVEKRIAHLEEVEEALRQTLALANTAAEDDITRLTSVYENMKAKDAAKLFETMEHSFAAGFISRMRTEAAAEIMAGLSPEAAYAISVILAGRNANAPKT